MEAIRNLVPHVAQLIHVDDVHDVLGKFMSKRPVGSLFTRSEEQAWSGKELFMQGFLCLQFLLILSMVLEFSYSLCTLFPTLAMVEANAPPPYTAVVDEEATVEEEAVVEKETGETKGDADEEQQAAPALPVTTRAKTIYRLLNSINGRRSVFRGLLCSIVYNIVFFAALFVLSMVLAMPAIISVTIASLLTTQLSTAWVHIVISAPSPKPFWRRLPSFKLALRATALPTLTLCAASQFTRIVILGWAAEALGGDFAKMDLPSLALFFLLEIFSSFCIVVPALAVLIRVQASLLPEEDRPIVSLDPALSLHKAEGKEYMSMLDALKSMSRASWSRLYILYADIYFLGIAAFISVGTFLYLLDIFILSL